jgi:hypothetical protein
VKSFERRKRTFVNSMPNETLIMLVRSLSLCLLLASSLKVIFVACRTRRPTPPPPERPSRQPGRARSSSSRAYVLLLFSLLHLVLTQHPSADHLSAVHHVHSSREKLKAAEDKLHAAQTAHPPDPQRVHRAQVKLQQAEKEFGEAKTEEKRLRAGTGRLFLFFPLCFD